MEESNNRVPSGSKIIDLILGGGYEKDVVTTIYGPAGAGKTVLSILLSITIARTGKKVIFVDSEGGFSAERLEQITSSIHYDHKKIMDKIIFLRPTKFSEQMKAFEKLKDIINDRIGLVVVDSIAMLYRLELGKSENIQEVNRELGRQIGYIKCII